MTGSFTEARETRRREGRGRALGEAEATGATDGSTEVGVSPGARGPSAPKPKVRTLEPSALAMDKPGDASPYAICDPSGDQCAPDSPVITSVKSEPSGAKV